MFSLAACGEVQIVEVERVVTVEVQKVLTVEVEKIVTPTPTAVATECSESDWDYLLDLVARYEAFEDSLTLAFSGGAPALREGAQAMSEQQADLMAVTAPGGCREAYTALTIWVGVANHTFSSIMAAADEGAGSQVQVAAFLGFLSFFEYRRDAAIEINTALESIGKLPRLRVPDEDPLKEIEWWASSTSPPTATPTRAATRAPTRATVSGTGTSAKKVTLPAGTYEVEVQWENNFIRAFGASTAGILQVQLLNIADFRCRFLVAFELSSSGSQTHFCEHAGGELRIQVDAQGNAEWSITFVRD